MAGGVETLYRRASFSTDQDPGTLENRIDERVLASDWQHCECASNATTALPLCHPLVRYLEMPKGQP